MHNSYIAIVAAALAAWIFGAIYYGVLGKSWQRAQGLDPEQCKGQKMPLAPMVASLLSALIMAYVLQHLLSDGCALSREIGHFHFAALHGVTHGRERAEERHRCQHEQHERHAQHPVESFANGHV